MASDRPLGGTAVMVLAAGALASSGCFTFAGLELASDGGGGGGVASVGSTSDGAGGDGGGEPKNDPDAFLPMLDAAELCALAADCPLLAASIVASLGLPVVAVDAGPPARLSFSYAQCLDWLAAPIAPGRVGFDAQRELLIDVVASGCERGVALLPVEAIATALDPRCAGAPEPHCDEDDEGALVDCADGLVFHCDAAVFAPSSSCVAGDDGAPRCGIAAKTCGDADACDVDYAVACEDGVLQQYDCSSLGLGCGGGTCRGEDGDASCDRAEAGVQQCSPGGERATVCTGRFFSEVDCEALGLECVEVGDDIARCGDLAAEEAGRCEPYDPDVDVCDGDVLHTCVGGEPVDLDCGVIGRSCQAPYAKDGIDKSARCATFPF